jgi:hypothetical protein
MPDLSNSERSDLYQMFQSPGFEIFRRLLKDEEGQLREEWIAADPARTDAVWAAQAVAHGYFVGVANVLNRLQMEVERFRKSLNAQPEPSEEQKFIEETISPFGGLPGS